MVIKCCTAKVRNSKKDFINHVYVQHLGGWASMWCHRGEGLAGARKAHTHLHSTAGDFNRTGNKATACMHWTGMRRRVRCFISSALMRQGRAARVRSLGGDSGAASVPKLSLVEEGMPQRLPRGHALGWVIGQQLLDQIPQLLRVGTHRRAAARGQQALHWNQFVHRPDAALAGRPCRHGGRGHIDAIRQQWRLSSHLDKSLLYLPAALAGSVKKTATHPAMAALPKTSKPSCRCS